MKSSFFASLALVAASSISCAQEPQNLIKNGDFELDSPLSPPPGWAKWGKNQTNDPQAYTRDTTQFHAGKASYRIFHPAGAGGYTASQPGENSFEAELGASYEISFWAKTDVPGSSSFQVQALQNLKPLVAVKNPLGRTLDVTTEWKKFSFELHEGFNSFFADTQRHLYLTFGANTGANVDTAKNLWVDDVVVTKKPDEPGVLKIDRLPYTPVNHRLVPGETLKINVDARQKLRRATKEATAVSFHRVNGNMGLPYNAAGEYKLMQEQEESIRALQLPWTRFFGLGDQQFSLETAIDGAANVVERAGIGAENTVLEFEDGQAKKKLTPEEWAGGIAYSRQKGYKFHWWEISNEPWVRTSKRVNVFNGPKDYVEHVKNVSAAIRKTDPNAKIGMAFEPRWLGWGSSLLKNTAGQADFVTTHWYSFVDPTTNPFELVVAGDNYLLLDQISRWNAALKAYNPGRDVYQWDTEWGLHALGKDGKTANDINQNGNIVGALYRVVRLIYYTREDIVRGASAWEMFGDRSNRWNSFALFPASGDKKSMLYWTHQIFNAHLGENVLEMSGTAPFYTPTAPSDRSRGIPLGGPLTPASVTLSADEKTMFVTIANASWDKNVPLELSVANFAAREVSGVRLSNDDVTRPGLLDDKSEFVHDFPVKMDGAKLVATIPAHSAVFLTLKR